MCIRDSCGNFAAVRVAALGQPCPPVATDHAMKVLKRLGKGEFRLGAKGFRVAAQAPLVEAAAADSFDASQLEACDDSAVADVSAQPSRASHLSGADAGAISEEGGLGVSSLSNGGGGESISAPVAAASALEAPLLEAGAASEGASMAHPSESPRRSAGGAGAH
eukprot:7572016-Pyramimonas_sp.AAC.1